MKQASREFLLGIENEPVTPVRVAEDIARDFRATKIHAKVSVLDRGVLVRTPRKTSSLMTIIEIYESAYPEVRIGVIEDLRGSGFLTTARAGEIQEYLAGNPDASVNDLISKYPDLEDQVPRDVVKSWIDNFRANGTGLIGS